MSGSEMGFLRICRASWLLGKRAPARARHSRGDGLVLRRAETLLPTSVRCAIKFHVPPLSNFRITMLPVFPKAEDFCTKMPVRIRMTHKPRGPKSCRISFPASKYGLGQCGMVDIEESLDLDLSDNPSAVVQKVSVLMSLPMVFLQSKVFTNNASLIRLNSNLPRS